MMIVFPIIPWGYLWQRPQQILTRLGVLGHTSLYLGIQKSSETEVRTSLATPGVFHLWLRTAHEFDLHKDQLTEELLSSWCNQLEHKLQTLDKKELIYLIQHPAWLPLVEAIKKRVPGIVWYDCMDRIASFPNAQSWIVDYEDTLFRLADETTVSSAPLNLNVSRLTQNGVTTIRNGVDCTLFTPCFEALSEGKRPTIGYYGSLGEWVDFDAIFRIAKQHPEWNFLFIGPEAELPAKAGFDLTNIEFRDAVPYVEIPPILATFDVALLPFKRNLLTEAVNPVKVYEYLAAGKPVASVALPELESLKDELYLVESTESLEAAISEALKEAYNPNIQIRERRRKVAEDNSWDKRTLQFKEIIERLEGTRSKQAALVTSLYSEAILDVHAAWQKRYNEQTIFWTTETQRIYADRDQQLGKKDRDWKTELDKRENIWRAEVETHQEIIRKLRS